MKIKPEHYEYMKTAINSLPCKINDHREWLKNNAKFNDLENRLRWDLFHAAKLSKYVCDNIYSYANDTHIDTALKNIVKEIELNQI